MDKRRLRYLLESVLNNNASAEELKEYEEWYEQVQGESRDMFADELSGDAIAARESILQSINKEIEKYETGNAPAPIKNIYRRVAVAATVLAVLASGIFYFFLQKPPVTSNMAQIRTAGTVIHNNENDLIHVVDTGLAVEKIALKDGSSVKLFPGSEISYYKNFRRDRREIILSGKAFFQVAKDSTRPFTVFSNSISTTALGTSFTITALRNRDSVEVILHTGKVVVKRQPDTAIQHSGEIHMVAGQRLTWSLSNGLARVMETTAEKPSSVTPDNISYGSRNGFIALFNEEPLGQVLDKIEKGYSVKITYRPSEIKDMFFSGKIRATDSLSQVLQRIAVLQDLEISLKKQQYIIRKQH